MEFFHCTISSLFLNKVNIKDHTTLELLHLCIYQPLKPNSLVTVDWLHFEMIITHFCGGAGHTDMIIFSSF